jgi:3'-5' exoribonuclease
MEPMTIREVKQAAAGGPVMAEVRAQIESSQVKPTKSGGEFLELKLADAEDGFTMRVWSDAAGYGPARAIAAGEFVALSGEWSLNQYGLEPRSWKLRALEPDEAAELLGGPPALREKQARDYADIIAFIEGVNDPRLRALGQQFLREYGERLKRTGAAREYHHARRGGLVEHTAQMMRCADAICRVYPQVNRDLVITGVLFHDCGKLWENCYAEGGFTMPYHEHGELMGHIPLGIELVNKLWRRLLENEEAAAWHDLKPANEEVRLHLLHLIGSHHGEYQFGSPVLPKTPEAIVLHHVDNVDAKLEMMFTTYATSPLLARNIFERQRPLPANLVRQLEHFPPPAELTPPGPESITPA